MSTAHHNELVSSLIHRAVICQPSEFFAAACDSEFKEAITATVTLDDDDQSTVRRMLTYDDGDASRAVAVAASQNTAGRVAESSSQPEVVDDAKTSHRKRMNNVRVYALAEKYNIPVGKDLAKTKFTECKYAFEYSQYREVIDVVFGSTPVGSTPETDSGLRNVVIQTANLNNEKMLKEEGLAPAIRDRGDFGLGILKEFVKKHTSELEKQKQDSRTRAIELRLALGSLHDEAMHVHIPAKQDSLWRTLSVFVRLWEDFNRSF